MSGALLEVEGLVTTFPSGRVRARVVDQVDLSLRAGEVLSLVGESGCGKSVTALSVLRLVQRPGRIEAGSIRLEGRELLTLPVPEMRRIRGRAISMIFQEPMTSLNPVQRVGNQVVEALRLHTELSRPAALRRAVELFEAVRIPDPAQRIRAYPHQLSGGMKQRVMIAMALAARPQLLIADEPTTALDVTIQAEILSLLRQLREERNTAILLITHDLGVVNEVADRVAVMYAGRIVETGSRGALLSAPRHPYTRGLLRAIPARAQRGAALAEIPGVVPSPTATPRGCRFADRCESVLPRCREDVPGPVAVGDAHWAHCHAVAEEEGVHS